MNWTELNWSSNKSMRSLVTRVSMTTWLAAAKLGRLALSQFVRYEHSLGKNVLRTSLHSHRELKKQDTKLLPITLPNINRFSKFYTTGRLSGKFATNSYLNIPPNLKCLASLPCEIRMSENWWESEICIVINDKRQGSIANHLTCDAFFITNI